MSADESNNPMPRQQLIKKLMAEHFDVLIIGGGSTGAGAALEASSRGLKTALIEAQDFSFGTSSRSTKLIHGGVRYLENAIKKLNFNEYKLVRDALAERKNFLDNAPHLTRPLPILTPVYSWFAASYYLAGLKVYDAIAGTKTLGPSEFIPKHETLKRFPHLKERHLKGAVVYYDGQFDDARMNLALILTAMREGTVALNYMRLLALNKKDGIINGAVVIDEETKQQFKVSARIVINATGPYADHVRHMDSPTAENIMHQSRGSHIILHQKFCPSHTGLVIPKTKDGRVLFVLPWQDKTMVGTTDDPYPLTEYPKADNDEIDYILTHLADYYQTPIKRSDILATWSGLRPLATLKQGMHHTAAMSRDHLIETSHGRLITIVGGKWTTYRIMAQDVIETAILTSQLKPQRESRSKTMKLIGAEHYKKDFAKKLAQDEHIAHDIAEHLAKTYGDLAYHVIRLASKDPKKRILHNYPYIEAEILYACRHEYAIHAMDILARRWRLAFIDNRAARAALPYVVAIMAPLQNWDSLRIQQEIAQANAFLDTMTTDAPP